jgi:hypothetical protein
MTIISRATIHSSRVRSLFSKLSVITFCLDSYSGHICRTDAEHYSFMADYFFWNTTFTDFTSQTSFLHASSGALLYFLLRRVLESLWTGRAPGDGKPENSPAVSLTAFLAALIWSVHPVHSAAIDYISGRADSLAFVFACGGWLLYLRAREIRWRPARIAECGLAAIAGLLALCSRETALIWFGIFLLHRIFFEKNTARRAKVATLVVCLSLIGLYLGLRHLPEQRPGPGPTNAWSSPVRAVLMLRALGDYGRLMVFPLKLHMERDVFDPDNYRSPSSWQRSASIRVSLHTRSVAVRRARFRDHSQNSGAADANFGRRLVCLRLSALFQPHPAQRHCRRALALSSQCWSADFSGRMCA